MQVIVVAKPSKHWRHRTSPAIFPTLASINQKEKASLITVLVITTSAKKTSDYITKRPILTKKVTGRNNTEAVSWIANTAR